MKLALFLSAALLAATAMAQASTSTEDLTPTDVLAQLPDFPTHWNQANLYNQVIRDEYGNSAPAGCVPVAGAACMEWFGFPDAFGALAFPGVKRELRTETLDWARLKPVPLDARGRRTAQTILYNLGLYGQIYYVSGGSSTMPLQYLAAVLTSPEVGYASAYFVEFTSNATDAEVETTIWASLRCGSPVAMSVSRDGGAHAVVATGCGTNAAGEPLTQVFGGYGSAPTWMDVPTQMKVPGGYTYNKLASVVTGIVAKRPEGVDSGLALPVLGTVKDTAGKPVPFAKVTLSINDQVVAETATDFEGRYGLWGWFGHDMTVSCGETTKNIPKQNFPGSLDWDTNNLLGTGNWEVSASALASAIEKATVDFTTFPAATYPTIHTSLDKAKDADTTSGTQILCLNSEDPDLKEAFREVNKYTLLYADPRLPAPFPEVDTRPDATAFILDSTEKIINYTVAKSVSDLNAFIANPTNPGENNIKGDSSITTLYNGKDAKFSSGVTITVDDDIRLGNIAVGADVTFTGNGTLTWGTLSQSGLITLAGPNLRYIPPKVGDGTSSAFPASFTVKNGAELYFGNGDVSGYGVTTGTITIGPKGILCVASRDTLNRPLVLAGGEVHLGNKDGNFGSLDLFSTSIKVTADSSISGLSGAKNPQLMVRDGTSTITLSNDARLSVSVPINAADKSKDVLSLSGNGVAAFGSVSAPVIAGSGVLLEGGIFSGGLSLTNGARLSALHPITVTGTLTVSGTVSIEEPRSGVLIYGTTTTDIDESLFELPDDFALRKVGNNYRLVAAHATAPVIYMDGAIAEALPNTPERNLLVFTTTDYKEFGIWEDYALYRSSAEGGDWNVKVASIGNVPEGQSVEAYVQAAGCSYILLGGAVSDIPTFTTPDGACTDAPYAAEGQHVGRLPLRETLQMETAATGGATATTVTYDAQTQIARFVAKLRRAEYPFARGRLTLLGGGYGLLTPPPRPNRTDYTDTAEYTAAIKDYYDNVYPAYEASIYSQTNKEDYSTYDGLPGNADDSWRFTSKEGSYTLFALRDRYREFRRKADGAFPNDTLFIYDSTAPAATSTDKARQQDGALLWVEGRIGRTQAGPICTSGADVAQFNVGSASGLYSLAITPSGQSGDFSQADSPSVGEMLVLNPQGGALTVLAPTGTDATLSVSGTGIPSSNTHTVCAAVAENLIEDPSLTVGQAFSQALTDNSGLSTTLTLLGDPTVRVMAWPEPEPLLPEGATLAEETLDALRAVAEAGGLFKDYEVAVTTLDGTVRPMAELDDALACFDGLEPTVEGDKVVVAYDFGVTGLRIEGTTVFVTLSVRGKGQSLTFTEGNDYAIAPQSLDGTQPLAAPETVTATTNEGSTVELRFSLPEGDATFLFRATVSRPTTP